MTMLEDDLREMFQARVHISPAVMDSAGYSIRKGRWGIMRRKATIGGVATLVFLAILGGTASIKGFFNPQDTAGGDRVTFDALYGPGLDPPERAVESLPVIKMPVDVHVGKALWTTDGRELTLQGVDQVIDVVRVPAGWLYSDDIRLRLLTFGGQFVPLRQDVSAWTVSPDGQTVATVYSGSNLEIHPAAGGEGPKTVVPTGTRAVAFDSGRVVLARDGYGTDYWSGAAAAYQPAWEARLVTIYTSAGDTPVGLAQEDGTTCLVELSAGSGGWLVGARLGCGDLLATAAHAGYGQARAARSPDGRWLAVPSATGVHLIDIHASRQAASSGGPVVAHSCASAPDAPAVWSDANTVLTISAANGVIACGTNGLRYAVQLPSGVSDGWELVRRYGVPH